MSTITRERVAKFIKNPLDNGLTRGEQMELARIALASLEAEPVCVIDQANLDYLNAGSDADVWPASRTEMGDVLLYRSAPTAPVVPDMAAVGEMPFLGTQEKAFVSGWNACRAAMLQGADSELQRKAAIHDTLCEKYSVESLADFVDWQRNHIAELEAAPPAPVGHGQTAVVPDYPGYVMTQRECYQAGKKAGLDEAGNSPVIPDGWVMVPMKLTAENGAKGALLGEFSETKFINCPECFGDDECDTCDGSGTIKIKLQVSWTTIKAIWARGVEHFAAAPQQEVKP